MNFSPHDYQAYAIDYIETHPVAAVLLDMGLGKTVISLTAIADLLFDSFEAHRILVVAPLRVARDTWPAEIEKWEHLQHLTYSVVVGTPKERRAALMANADITIINRENLQWLIEDSGFPFTYDMVCIDELSSFKNHKSKRFQALMKVRPKVKRIIGLTGTPSSSGLMDLWAEFKLLDMGQRLGRFITQYRNDYFLPDKRNGQIIYSYKPMPYAEDAIYRKISDMTISMKSTDHLKMPELVSSRYEVKLSEAEAQRYDDLKQELILQLPEGEVTAANAASLTGKLVQLANGAIYSDDGDITSVNAGKNYVCDDDAVAEIGWIWTSEIWEDVTLPGNLLRKASTRMMELSKGITSIELTIIDESDTGADIGDIRARMYVKCLSKPHGIDGTYLCVSRTRDYLNPSGNTITIGASGVTLTSATAKQGQNISALEDDLLGKTAQIEIISGKVDDINASKMYRTELVVEGVSIFRDKGQQSLMRCKVYSWDKDITDTLAAACFIWHRRSNDDAADAEWDASHSGMKTITISTEDVQDNASFFCEVII